MREQNFSNHTKLVPAFHFFVLPVLIINVVGAVHYWYVKTWSLDGAIWVLTSVALLIGILLARVFAVSVQDRVIRLEERLRYERLLPQDLQARFGEFEIGQLVSLRFASDAELPGLARRVLDEKIKDGKAIKKLIQNWRADNLRA
jgi:small-conductance mechanosensitive channel